MAKTAIAITLLNGRAFIRGLEESKKLSLRFMRTELKRGAQRVRKSFIKTQLKSRGPKSIKAGPLAKGKNVWTFVKGNRPKTIFAKIGISRVLHVHEIGATIRPTRGDFLYIRENKKQGAGRIVAAVPEIRIPARLRFRQHVAKEGVGVLKKVGEAAARGTEVAMKKVLKQTVGV